jgi:predicted ATPase
MKAHFNNSSVANREKVDELTIGQQESFLALNENIQQAIRGLINTSSLFNTNVIKENSAIAVENLAQHEKTRETILSTVYQIETKAAISQLLQSLSFPEMQDRQHTICDAHAKTFKWIFDEKNNQCLRTWSSFTDWLQHGRGIYWINGKAGSGKSTLMRYQCVKEIIKLINLLNFKIMIS